MSSHVTAFTQKFTLQSVKTNLATSPEKVGQYQVQSTHALDLTAQAASAACAFFGERPFDDPDHRAGPRRAYHAHTLHPPTRPGAAPKRW